MTVGRHHGGVDEYYSRAIVIVPKIDAFERLLTNYVGARFVRRAIPLDVSGHGGLSPLSPVGRRRQRKISSLQTYVVQTTLNDFTIYSQHSVT